MKLVAFGLVITLLAGCSSNPTLPAALPATPLPRSFHGAEAYPKASESSAEHPWWHEYGQAQLSSLVADALTRNLDLEVALARLEQARGLLDAGRATAYPRVDLSGGAARTRASLEDPAGNPFAPRTGTRWTADATVTWEADLFGSRDAANQALGWRAASSDARATAVRMSIIADVLGQAFDFAALRDRLVVAGEAVSVNRDLLTLMRAKSAAGLASHQDVERAQAQLSRSEAQVAQLKFSRADRTAALAMLLATTPQDITERLDSLALPDPSSLSIRLTAPSDLLRGRPDIQQASAELRAASADLEATAAERFPRFDIAATLGFVASAASGLGTVNALAASVSPTVRWAALDFSELDARVRSRRAVERMAVAGYKYAVVRAFAEAQTALLQLDQRRQQEAAARSAWQAQSDAWEIQRAQFKAGLNDLVPTLEAHRDLQSAKDAWIQALVDVLATQVLLHKALGSGDPGDKSNAARVGINSTGPLDSAFCFHPPCS